MKHSKQSRAWIVLSVAVLTLAAFGLLVATTGGAGGSEVANKAALAEGSGSSSGSPWGGPLFGSKRADAPELASGPRGDRPTQPGAQEPRTILCELVLEDGRPAAAASVWHVDQTCVPNQRSWRATDASESLSPAERLKALGKFCVADADGRIQLSVIGRHLDLRAEHGHLAATESFDLDSHSADPLRVTLASGDVLEALLVDPSGAPIAEAPLVVGPHRLGGGLQPTLRVQLGSTNKEGRLSFAGWRRLESDLKARAGSAPLAIGVEYVGGLLSTVVVPAMGSGMLRLVAPRPLLCSFEFVDATGAPLHWGGHVLRVVEDATGLEGVAVVAERARANLLVVPFSSYRWQFGSGSGIRPVSVLGEGVFWLGESGRVSLACSHVVRVTGRLADGEARNGLRVHFGSEIRERQDLALHVDESGRFQFQVARGDLGPLVFLRGEDRVGTALPPLDRPWVDLGIVAFTGAPFAEVRLADESGRPLSSGSVSLCGEVRNRGHVRRLEEGQYQVETAVADATVGPHLREVLVDCSAPGHHRKLVRVSVGEVRRVVLPRLGDMRVHVRLGLEVPSSRIWVVLERRFDEHEAAWELADRWAACAAGPDGASFATFPAQPPGRYEVAVLSGMPPSCLAKGEVALAEDRPASMDAMGARAVALELQFEPGSVGKCYLAAGTTVEAYDRQPLCLAAVAPGTTQCVLRGDETWLVVLGPSILPGKIRARGTNSSYVVQARGSGSPGVAEGLRIHRPIGPAYDDKRSWQIFSQNGGSMHREILRRDDILGGPCGWLLPTDYDATDQNGQPARLVFGADGTWHRRL